MKGYEQHEDIDYGEIFAPIIMLKTVYILLVLVIYYNWEVYQIDVIMAFLNLILKEKVYIAQPKGFE